MEQARLIISNIAGETTIEANRALRPHSAAWGSNRLGSVGGVRIAFNYDSNLVGKRSR